jgi:nicotinate phosphoribosyltransferase
MVEDLVTSADDTPPQGPWEPLLEPWIRGGTLCREVPALQESREHARSQLASLPEELRALAQAPPFPVRLTPALQGSRKDDAEAGPARL